MPLPRPLLDHTAAALAAVLEFKHPADAVVSRYLRAHPILGQQDRAFVAETVFAVLRRLRLLETLSAGRDPRRLVLAALTTAARPEPARAGHGDKTEGTRMAGRTQGASGG